MGLRVPNHPLEHAFEYFDQTGFYPSDTAGSRWESTLYRGAHWVEAFVIRKRDQVCIGKSERFFVVIE